MLVARKKIIEKIREESHRSSRNMKVRSENIKYLSVILSIRSKIPMVLKRLTIFNDQVIRDITISALNFLI